MGLNNDIKLPRWMTDKVAMVLALHPLMPMRSSAVWKAAQGLGWSGTFVHCRKTLSLYKDIFTKVDGRVGSGWTLTAVGHTLQNQILNSMTDTLALHARARGAAQAQPTTAITYQRNGSGAHVCVGCGVALGMAHTPMCVHEASPHGDVGLDANVTER